MGDEEAVAKVMHLLGRYPRAVDTHDEEALPELFDEEGAFVLPDRAIVGRAALSEFAAATPRGVHVTGLPAVDIGTDEATSVSSFIFHNGDTNVIISGYYHDRIPLREGPLRFKERRVELIGKWGSVIS